MKKTYLITGGTGSFGKAFSEKLTKKKLAKRIIIFSRDEFKQFQMQELDFVKKNKDIFRFFLGDVRDKARIDYAFGEANFTRKVPFGFEGFKGIGIVASVSDPADRAGLERHLSKSGI